MERNLMAKQDMSELGFHKVNEPDLSAESNANTNKQASPSSTGKTLPA
ncbi:cytochrome c oxidase assembly protein COX19-like [Iris pallida]|uniref:Cytochrome c oxidase assembly protein COX19-like n=1 Tax=Iris pallida TaxID=29817 RepID=A0AAX6FG94_IRIPA|nr:cytochrome c oxidase assembly protein COX19-like [Iris pallida]